MSLGVSPEAVYAVLVLFAAHIGAFAPMVGSADYLPPVYGNIPASSKGEIVAGGAGSDYPVAGLADAGPILQTALAAAIAADMTLHIVGDVTIITDVVLTNPAHNNATILIEGELTDGGTTNGMFVSSALNVTLLVRNGIITGNGASANPLIKSTNAGGLLYDIDATFNSFRQTGTAFLTFFGTASGIVRGQWQTADSQVFYSRAVGPIEVSGFSTITGGYTSLPVGNSVFNIGPAAGGPAINGFNLHDIYIDGGSQAFTTGTGLIDIDNGTSNTYPIVDLKLSRITVKNAGSGSLVTQTYADGIDLRGISSLTASDLTFDHVGDGITWQNTTNAEVKGVIGTNLRWYAVQVGDPGAQFAASVRAVVSDCVAQDCGQGSANTWQSGGFGVISGNNGTVSGTVTDTYFENCVSMNTGGAQLSGLVISIVDLTGAHGSITTVSWSGGKLLGATNAVTTHTAGFGALTPAGYSVFNAVGANTVGVVASPFDATDLTIGLSTNANAKAAAPTLTDVYVCSPTPLHMEIAESATGTGTWKDSAGNTKLALAASTKYSFTMEVGDSIVFATAVPTTIVAATSH